MYNGWSNYETWRVNLEWFDDVEYFLELFDEKPEVEELASTLEHYITEVAEGIQGTLVGAEWTLFQYATTWLEGVDYEEIAESMLDDEDLYPSHWAEEEEDEEE